MASVAIVGAGLAGLVAGRHLATRAEVVLFEKSRGPGGRMATRYYDEHEFDHGAQFFTARSQAFRDFLEPLVAAGHVAVWKARFAEIRDGQISASRTWDDAYPHYVGSPRMNALGKALATGLDIRLGTSVSRVRRGGAGWQLLDADGTPLGEFDWVLLTAPAEQTLRLAPNIPDLAELCRGARMRSCFALMLGFDEPVELPFDAARVRGRDISWIAANGSKPARNDRSAVLVHSTNAWADDNIDRDAGEVREHLAATFADVTGIDAASATVRELHRWRYANLDKRDGPKHFVDAERQLAACGDWFIRGRVEAAFTSAASAAAAITPLV